MANYVLFSKKQVLPPDGLLGVRLEERDGDCIRTVLSGGAAAKAGLKKSAVIIDIDGHPVRKIADTRLALWDKGPGEMVGVSIRGSPAAKTEHFEVILASTQTK
jgi:C-terminal processing protease CtpA/Prc